MSQQDWWTVPLAQLCVYCTTMLIAVTCLQENICLLTVSFAGLRGFRSKDGCRMLPFLYQPQWVPLYLERFVVAHGDLLSWIVQRQKQKHCWGVCRWKWHKRHWCWVSKWCDISWGPKRWTLVKQSVGTIYTVSHKKQAKLFLLQLRQTSTKSDNFWHKDGKLSKIIWGALIFHLI